MKNVKNKLWLIFAILALVGFVTISCSNGSTDNSGSNPVAVTGVTLDQSVLPLIFGTTETATLTAIVAPSNATNKAVTWSSSNEEVATVDGGNVTAIAAGTTTITVTTADGGFTDTCAVTVYAEGSIVKITIEEIEGVYAPVAEETPVSVITETAQFTGTVAWSPEMDANGKFKSHTVYTAAITLTPKESFMLQGITANFFTVTGATTTNAADSGLVTAVFPATCGTQAEELVDKWYGLAAAAIPPITATPYYQFEDGGKAYSDGNHNDFFWTVDGNKIVITRLGSTQEAKFLVYGTTLTIYETTGTFLKNGVYYKQSTKGTAINAGDSDYTAGTLVTTFNVSNPMQWEAASSAISTGGNNRKYIINIIGDITIPHITGDMGSAMYTFGNSVDYSQNITVSIRGTGTLALSNTTPGSLLSVRNAHTVILHGLTLKGINNNDDALVVNNGTFIMNSGKITGNKNTGTDEYGNGGGIRNEPKDMLGGDFIMAGGEISGNSAKNGGGVYGIVQISNGKIYGNDVTDGSQNTASADGASLWGAALLGSYSGGTFTENANPNITSNENSTIWVVNGKRMYSDVGNPPNYLFDKVWYTSQENANKRIGNTIEFIDDGRIFEDEVYSGMTYSANGTALTVKKASQQESRTLSYAESGAGQERELKLTVGGSGTLLAGSYFMPNPDYVPTFDITNDAEWANAYTFANGKKGKLNFNIMNDVSGVAGTTTAISAAAGETLEITIKGIGAARTVSLSSNGSILLIGARVTVTLAENITLQGKAGNNTYLVYNGGTMIMNAGCRITGNTNSKSSADQRVYNMIGGVYNGGTFIMNGGEISNNYVTANGTTNYSTTWVDASGGGVYNGGTFTMKGGTISGNGASASGGNNTNRQAYGGGVENGGTFQIITGTISGNTISSKNGNGVSSGANLYGTATYGPNGTGSSLSTTSAAITVVDGVLQ